MQAAGIPKRIYWANKADTVPCFRKIPAKILVRDAVLTLLKKPTWAALFTFAPFVNRYKYFMGSLVNVFYPKASELAGFLQ